MIKLSNDNLICLHIVGPIQTLKWVKETNNNLSLIKKTLVSMSFTLVS
jgi:hypothetical protein